MESRLQTSSWQGIEKTCHKIKRRREQDVNQTIGNMEKKSKEHEMAKWNPTKTKRKK
jgi:hypothetical protein